MKHYLITKTVLRELLQLQRQDFRKGIATASEVGAILGVSPKNVSRLAAKKGTKLRPSQTQRGKYIYSSVIAEFKNIHGVSYYEAIELKDK